MQDRKAATCWLEAEAETENPPRSTETSYYRLVDVSKQCMITSETLIVVRVLVRRVATLKKRVEEYTV